jgi:hypothetical protein
MEIQPVLKFDGTQAVVTMVQIRIGELLVPLVI